MLAGVAVDHFVEELGGLEQTEQVRARITAASLRACRCPIANQAQGSGHPMDRWPGANKIVGQVWQNCLGEYLHEVNEGTTLIYHAPDEGSPAAAVVAQANRLTWAMMNIKGAKNVDIDP